MDKGQPHAYGHNILELYNVLGQARFTISKTELDIYYNKHWLFYELRNDFMTEDLRKLANIRNVSSLDVDIA